MFALGCAPEAPPPDSSGPAVSDAAPASPPSIAASSGAADQAQPTELSDKLAKLAGSPPDSITESSVTGMKEARWGMTFGYITADESAIIVEGNMLDIATGKNLTEASRGALRAAVMAKLVDDSTITFAPDNAISTVTVFTDVDCGFCRKLHQEMAEYHELGIAVRYVGYPRSGPDTESFRKTAAVWCSSDKHSAMNAAQAGDPMAGVESDCNNPVAAHFALGSEIGLQGTPLLILEDGSAVNGYMPAAALAARIAEIKSGG